jgi:hypothetical protein
MTALDLPNPGLFEGGRTQAPAVRGRWSLVAGCAVETRSRRRSRWLPPLVRRGEDRVLPLVSGALIVGDLAHLTVGEVAVAVDKTHSVRLTIAEVTALGNRRYAVELIVSALGEDAGPDEIARLEGHADRGRGGGLKIVLSGSAPTGLGGADSRIRLTAAFGR